MRFGRDLSCKQVASSLDCSPTKATQAWEPALIKVATVLIDYPPQGQSALAEAMVWIQEQREIERMEIRARANDLKADRSELYPVEAT